MGILSSKSDKSYKVAVLLMSKGYYCNSVQCAYFSGLQLAKDKILENIADISKFKNDLKKESSHLTIIRKAGEYLNTADSKGKLIDLMTTLKRWRKNAIYDDTIFNERQAAEALSNCETIRYLLKQI